MFRIPRHALVVLEVVLLDKGIQIYVLISELVIVYRCKCRL